MCSVSFVLDHQYEIWDKRYRSRPFFPEPPLGPPLVVPTQEQIDEFMELLKRAREYDKRTNQPDCESAEKMAKFRELGEELGIDLSFLDEVE